MDVASFLSDRIRSARYFFVTASAPFQEEKHRIEQNLPPYDNPPYNEEGGEPPFFHEWEAAEIGLQIVGATCVSILSESLKLYFLTHSNLLGLDPINHVNKARTAFKENFEFDLADSGVDLQLIEEVTELRNSVRHPKHIVYIESRYDGDYQQKVQSPLFVRDEERDAWGSNEQFLIPTPTVHVTLEKFEKAADEILKLAEWIDQTLASKTTGIYGQKWIY